MAFSEEDLHLLGQTELLKARKRLYAQVNDVLQETFESLKPAVEETEYLWPKSAQIQAAKISRGEYLDNLPYMVLDYPGLLKEEDKLLFRVMFTWGKGFTLLFLFTGTWARHAWERRSRLARDAASRWCTSEKWQYDLSEFQSYRICVDKERPHPPHTLWLGSELDLKKWKELPSFATNRYLNWVKLLV